MAKQYKSLLPTKYYRDHLLHKIRPDGREFDKFRPIIVNVASIESADGSALVKIGKSTVVCGIKAELCRPKASIPDEGFIVPNLELPPLCSSKFRPGPPSDQAQIVTQLLAEIIKNSECVDLKDLCIYPDKLAWCLFIDLICLDFDGSIVDASIIAILGALKSLTLPVVEFDPVLDNKQVNTDVRNHLNIRSMPVSTTFALFEGGMVLVDPTLEEEHLCVGILTIVLKNDKISNIYKPGGVALSEDQIFNSIEIAKIRSTCVEKLVETALKKI